MMKNKLVLVVAAVGATVAVGSFLSPSNIDPAHKFSWSENRGWMDWRDADGTGAGVVVDLDFLSGMVWFENDGWMNVGDGAGPYANTTGLDFGVNVLSGGDLDGFAWRENGGWANFGWAAGTSNADRARVDVGNNRFRGFVWTENNGWINLDDETHYVGFESLCTPSSPALAETLSLSGDPESTKNRFLSFSAGDAGRTQAVRITFVSLPAPFDLWDGSALWVGPSSLVSQAGSSAAPLPGFPNFSAARLQCTAFYTDFSALGVVHVFHEGIVPLGNYRVEVVDQVCDNTSAASFSAPIVMDAARWGDTVFNLSVVPAPPPEGFVNVVDALAVLSRFSSVATSIVKARADLEPGCLDLTINVSDVLSSLAGFSGLSYPFTPTAADPCNSTCPNPLP